MNGVTVIAAGLWAAYLVAAVGSGATAALTAPIQRHLALAAAVAFIVLLLLAKPTRGARGDRLLLLVHGLPLILLLRLGGGAWADRTLPPSVWPRLAEALTGATVTVPVPPPGEDEAAEWPLDRIVRVAEPGQRLRTLGRISRAPAGLSLPVTPTASWSQPNLVLLYRFRMTCCAADATPTAILVVLAGEVPPEGTWIACTGAVLGRFGADGSVVVLGASAWSEQPPPSQPFLIGSRTPSLY